MLVKDKSQLDCTGNAPNCKKVVCPRLDEHVERAGCHGNPSSILRMLLYCTNSTLYVRNVYLTQRPIMWTCKKL